MQDSGAVMVSLEYSSMNVTVDQLILLIVSAIPSCHPNPVQGEGSRDERWYPIIDRNSSFKVRKHSRLNSLSYFVYLVLNIVCGFDA